MDKKIKILLVDDDVELREIYGEIFKNSNFEVFEAGDGLEGLEAATAKLPDVIFTGIVMPRMDGFSMIEALKKTVMTASIPIVISSHMGREEDRQRANSLGVKDFIIRGTTPPKEVIGRINALFTKIGGEYKIEFSTSGMDAEKMIKDFNFNQDFECVKCNRKMVLDLTLLNQKDKVFEAKFVCPGCGWEAK